MKKILLLLTILSYFSYSKNIKGDFSYNFNVTNNYDYNVKATFDSKERKWLYNPKYVYNKYNSSYQLANINGSINSSLGLYLKYTLESPIKLDEFDQKEAVSGDTIKLKKNPKKKKKKKKVSLSLQRKKLKKKKLRKML